MKAETLQQAMLGYVSLERCEQLLPGLLKAFEVGDLNNIRRRAMFLAQIGEESGSLKYQEEIGQGHGHSYYPYCGRTFIQITWDYNYRGFGQWCHSKGLLDDPEYFVNNYYRLADDKWAWLGPVWYWTVARPQLNALSDAGDIYGATQAINGGYNGIEDRKHRWQVCLGLGNALLGDEDDMPAPKDWDDKDWAAFNAHFDPKFKNLYEGVRESIRNALGAMITHKARGWFNHTNFPAAVPAPPKKDVK